MARFADAPESLPRQLIPLSGPAPGEQYAFEVDLDACTGCKSCVAACHSLNGLDDDETWRDVGLLVSTEPRRPFIQTITTACHHCSDPACLNGCPVLAYEKDPITGIVRHLDDQCIGCSYCILKCPYDVPKFSKRLGIVRKCDMCHGRLAHGEAPACAQACPTEAIRIISVSRIPDTEYRKGTDSNRGGAPHDSRPPVSGFRNPVSGIGISSFLPGAPDPSYTRPTTRYVTRRGIPEEVAAGDGDELPVQPTHWPLVVLLTLMPLAVGCTAAATLLGTSEIDVAVVRRILVTGTAAGLVGLVVSIFHLGRPERAWRVFLGLRRSWLSREAVAFGLWAPLALTATGSQFGIVTLSPPVARVVLATAAIVGVGALLCSAMIYADTRRRLWRLSQTVPRFFGTAAVLATAVAATASDSSRAQAVFLLLLALSTVAKLVVEAQVVVDVDSKPAAEAKTARLLRRSLRSLVDLRIYGALAGGVVIPVCVATAGATAALAWLGLALVACAETCERVLYFRAVDAPKMPGVPGASPRT